MRIVCEKFEQQRVLLNLSQQRVEHKDRFNESVNDMKYHLAIYQLQIYTINKTKANNNQSK